MRKVTRDAVNAFDANRKFSRGSTAVVVKGGDVMYTLHGHIIAQKRIGSHYVVIDTCGWDTVTTRERLNGLIGVHVNRSKGQLMLNGENWDGDEIIVNMRTGETSPVNQEVAA